MAGHTEVSEETPLLGSYNNNSASEDKPKQRSNVGSKSKSEKKAKKKVSWRVQILLIILTEMCERMAFFCIASSMVIFCTNVLQYSSAEALTFSLVFTGVIVMKLLYISFSLYEEFCFVFPECLFSRLNVMTTFIFLCFYLSFRSLFILEFYHQYQTSVWLLISIGIEKSILPVKFITSRLILSYWSVMIH